MPISMQDKPNVNSGLHEKETKNIAQGAGLIFAGRVIGGSVQYLYVVIIAQMLGMGNFGLLMLSQAVINLAGIVSRLGLDVGVVRFIAIHHGIDNKAGVKGTILQGLLVSFSVSVLIAGILCLLAKPLCSNVFGKPELAGLVKLLSISLPFYSIMTIALSTTRGLQIMKYTVYGQDIFFPVCNLVFASVLLALGCKVYGAASAYVAAVFLGSAVSIRFLTRAFPFTAGIKASYNTELLTFSMPLMFSLLLHSIVIWTDTLMLGRFRPSEDVGIYNVCAKTAALTSTVLLSFNTILAPIVSDFYKQNHIQKLGDMFKLVTRWIYSISLPIFLLMLLLSEELLTIFGHEYVSGKYVLIVLAFAQLVFAGTGSTAVMLAMTGRQYVVMFTTIGACIINSVLNYVLIQRYGMVGASIATGLSLIATTTVMLLCVYRLLKIHPYNRKFLTVTLLAAVAFAPAFAADCLMMRSGNTLKLLIVISLYLVIYAILSVKWAWYDEDWFIVNMLKTKFKASPQE